MGCDGCRGDGPEAFALAEDDVRDVRTDAGREGVAGVDAASGKGASARSAPGDGRTGRERAFSSEEAGDALGRLRAKVFLRYRGNYFQKRTL